MHKTIFGLKKDKYESKEYNISRIMSVLVQLKNDMSIDHPK